MTDDKILGKIAKLLALAAEDSGGTEEERNLAAERAQELMLKHRVSEHDLVGVQGKSSLPGIEEHRVGAFAMQHSWVHDLLIGVAEPMGCDVLHSAQRNRRVFWLVGRRDAIDYSIMMLNFLKPQIEREAMVSLANERETTRKEGWDWTAADSKNFVRSFGTGAAQKVTSRLRDARKKAEESVGSGMELIRLDQKDKDEFYGDNKPKDSSLTVYEGLGAMHGFAAGDKIDLNPDNKISGSKPRQLNR